MDTNRFDTRPAVKSKLNILPSHQEQEDPERIVGLGRFPSWLHRPLPKGNVLAQTGHILDSKRLHTVCEEAKCPNLLECWSKKTATFLVMGKECTRSCGFCSIDFSKKPKALEEDEPDRVAESVVELGLKHVVITMVARDDLEDGGAAHLAKIIAILRAKVPTITIEVLTSDFHGNQAAWDVVLRASPEIFNYNIETVRELTPNVRHTATYDRTLQLLSYVKNNRPSSKLLIKSGLMVGLGETQDQVFQTIKDLHTNGCDIITIGQYLQPNKKKLLVKEFVTPEIFKLYEEYGQQLGVKYMYCGPFVRSSYNADRVIEHF
jgi:lipoic acid synthetase